MLVCCSLAFAQNNQQAGNQDTSCQGTDCPQEMVQKQSQISGLENAMIRTRTQARTQQVEQTMMKVQTQRKEMLNGLKDLEIIEDDKEEITATGKAQGKLLGFISIQRKLRYNIDELGNVERVRTWHEFMWQKNENIN